MVCEFAPVTNALSKLINSLAGRIGDAAQKQDFAGVEKLNSTVRAIQTAQSIIDREHVSFGCCSQTQASPRSFFVQITAGAIRWSYLNVGDGTKKRYFTSGEIIRLRMPNGVEFESMIMPQNRLQERGKISGFFASDKTRPGDRFLVSEVSPRLWEMTRPN